MYKRVEPWLSLAAHNWQEDFSGTIIKSEVRIEHIYSWSVKLWWNRKIINPFENCKQWELQTRGTRRLILYTAINLYYKLINLCIFNTDDYKTGMKTKDKQA